MSSFGKLYRRPRIEMNKALITQSNYIPWKGYFDQINIADTFVIYDCVQYTRRDWRNRNKIKTPQGLQWLTIPVEVKGKYFQSIRDTKISDVNWAKPHWSSIKLNYSKAKFFKDYKDQFEQLYLGNSLQFLSEINYLFISEINKILEITTDIKWSSEFELSEDKSERLLNICKELNATSYLSGPAAKDYLSVDIFKKSNIEVEWMDYSNYKEYEQLYGPFDHFVSIIDLIFNNGPSSKNFLKSF